MIRLDSSSRRLPNGTVAVHELVEDEFRRLQHEVGKAVVLVLHPTEGAAAVTSNGEATLHSDTVRAALTGGAQ